jgi:outer membrane lipoprotein-sorting protein
MKLRTRRRLRWAVPAAALAALAGVTSVSRVLPADADPVPVLPALTPAELLAKVHDASVTTLSGDIRLSTRLGLPDLGSLGVQGGTLLDLLSGDHVAHVWIDGPERVRVAVDRPQAESDWIRNGTDLWSWDSSTQRVTHSTLADPTEPGAPDGVPGPDPATVAAELLAAIDPTTAVSVQTPGYVAGRPVYELVVAPRSDKSTIGDGVISVDAATGLPLAVRIDARGATSPAFQVEFTSLSFDKPDDARFAFTPPPGATVVQTADPLRALTAGPMGRDEHRVRRAAPDAVDGSTPDVPTGTTSHVTTIGSAWETVALISGLDVGRQLQPWLAGSPAIAVGSQSAHLVSTSLVNVLVLDDGRVAVAAMTPEAMAAAIAGS